MTSTLTEIPIYSQYFANGRYFIAITVLSLALIFFGSPLFATLGFEYSSISAIWLSLLCGLAVIRVAERGRGRKHIAADVFALALLPLALSAVSLLWLPNCAFLDGGIFYFEIAFPSAFLGAMFGFLALSFCGGRPKLSRKLFVGFWTLSLILSLIPGYFNPQLFTYGWQYGFFPGFIWDEALELSNAYLFSRLEQVVWILTLIALLKTRTGLMAWRISALAMILVSCVLFYCQDTLGVTSSTLSVGQVLTKSETVENHTTLHFVAGSYTNEELGRLKDDVRWYFHDIRDRFQLTDTSSTVDIFIYPTVEELYHAIGTRTASIAKPWLGQVHITRSSIGSLKHELTHVSLHEVGVFPFYASFSTGLTEGAAMSVEPQYDGLYTLDEHAEQIIQMHYANGVSQVMAFTGFAANASQKSYVLAGSFSRYLLSAYGAARFKRVYRSLSFISEYGVSLDTLEMRWKQWLLQYRMPLNNEDTARLRYYYDRSSIIYQPCIRRIGKLERKADDAFKQKRYADALGFYQTASSVGGGLSPLIGESNALFQMGRMKQALAVLDTPKSLDAVKQLPALFLREGDLNLFLGDTIQAGAKYQSAQRLKLSANAFLSAYIRNTLVQSPICDFYSQYLWFGYHEGNKAKMIGLLDSMRKRTVSEPAQTVLTYLILTNRPNQGTAYDIQWPNPIPFDDSLANYLMQETLAEQHRLNAEIPSQPPTRFARASRERTSELIREEEFLGLRKKQ